MNGHHLTLASGPIAGGFSDRGISDRGFSGHPLPGHSRRRRAFDRVGSRLGADRSWARRRGVAAVEFAVCLPVIILLVFGSIEASGFIFLKQSLNAAAYEGVREAIRLGADNDDGIERATAILTARGVSDFVVDFPSGDAGSADRGDEVVITVSAPTGSNRPITGQFLTDRVIVARVVMVKE